jgi:putative ABC transport system permease protein
MGRSPLSGWARVADVVTLLAGMVARESRDARLDEEVAFHIDMQAQRNVDAGMTPGSARRDARLRFGARDAWKDAARDEYRARPIEDLARDVRHGIAVLRRHPTFAACAILTIAIGIAATVTVFTFTDAIFRRRLPVPHADRLVRVHAFAQHEYSLGYFGYRLLRDRARSFDAIATHYSTAPLYVQSGAASAESMEIDGAVVSASYFSMLGLRPRLGRFFDASEDSVPDRDAVAVIGYGLWQARFGGSPSVLGQAIAINGRPFQLIGVAPEGFHGVMVGVSTNELWIPTMMLRVGYRWCDALRRDPPCNPTEVLARLAPGVSIEMAQREVATFGRELAAIVAPADTLRPILVAPATGMRPMSQAEYVDLCRMLSGIAGIVLLLACANLSGLLLVRGVTRRREVALRRSLGASRWRIVRQLLTEHAVIAAGGGAVGALISGWMTRALVALIVADNEGGKRVYDVTPNGSVLAFAVAITAVTVAIFGLLPAIQTSRVDAGEWIRGGGAGPVTTATRSTLIGVQVALAMTLLIGATMLSRSFARVVAGGAIRPSGIAVLRLRPRLIDYAPDTAQAFLRRAMDRVSALPDVESATLARGIGFIWRETGEVTVRLPGQAPREAGAEPEVVYHEVGPRFFSTLGVPMRSGREFVDGDRPETPRVAIVNETLATRLWPGRSPLGETVVLRDSAFRVVGVVADYRLHNAQEAAPAMAFVAFWQSPFAPQQDARLAVRVRGDPARALPMLQREIGRVDPLVPISETLTLRRQIAASYADVRLGGTVLAATALVALFLTAIGLYGVVAFLVARRTREIGIRLAVGAMPHSVVRLFVHQGLRPVLIGGLAGLAVSVAAGRLLTKWLYLVSPSDPTPYVLAALSIAIVALLATYLPARRAARVDPVAALRVD